MAENIAQGFVSTYGYDPDGFRVTVSLNLMYDEWSIEEAFRELGNLVAVGNLTVNPPGIEAGGKVIVASYIVRRVKESDGTVVIGFYDADLGAKYKLWHHYFNKNEYGKEQSIAFKEASGMDISFNDIPLWDDEDFPKPSKFQAAANQKYLYQLPHPVRIIRKDSGEVWVMDGKKYPKWWWDRCERATNNPDLLPLHPADEPARAWTMTWLIKQIIDWPAFEGISQHAANAVNKLRKEGAITDDMHETEALEVMEDKYLVPEDAAYRDAMGHRPRSFAPVADDDTMITVSTVDELDPANDDHYEPDAGDYGSDDEIPF